MVRRGDIVLVNLNPIKGSEQGKVRPAIIIQHDALNQTSNTTIIVPISSKIYEKTYPMHVPIETKNITKGTIKVEHIRSIDQIRIIKKLDIAPENILKQIGIALQQTCDYF